MSRVAACAIPVLDLQYPHAAPAILKAAAAMEGIDVTTFDFCLDLYKDICNKDKDLFDQLQTTLMLPLQSSQERDDVFDWLIEREDHKLLLRQWLTASVAKLVGYEVIGISVFSYNSHKTAMLLCAYIRRYLPDAKIVIGGKGAGISPFGPDLYSFVNHFSKITESAGKPIVYQDNMTLDQMLLQIGLIDHAIIGDAETAWPELLKKILNGEQGTGSVTTDIEDMDLNALPFVNYDDYDLEHYPYINGEKVLAITGSKGCVRKCRFCDIPVLWPKFKFRTGQNIAGEMIHLHERFGISKFYMTDSLVNGSLVAFRDFVKVLAEYNRKQGRKAIRWIGQYITRPIHQVPQDIYRDIADSGGEGLTIGVETGSDTVRAHMQKKFSTSDLDHELEQFSKHRISCVLLFFSCYPTETWDDFVDTLKMLMRYRKYAADNTVYKATLGVPYTHHIDTPLWYMHEELGLTFDYASDILWKVETNPELDFIERIRRRLIMQEVAAAITFPLSRNYFELLQLSEQLKTQRDLINDFFGTHNKVVPTYGNLHDLPHIGKITLIPPDIQAMIADVLANDTVDWSKKFWGDGDIAIDKETMDKMIKDLSEHHLHKRS